MSKILAKAMLAALHSMSEDSFWDAQIPDGYYDGDDNDEREVPEDHMTWVQAEEQLLAIIGAK